MDILQEKCYFCIQTILLLSFQKHSFISMYEERRVDVASYVGKILDQMPPTPVSPMYVD